MTTPLVTIDTEHVEMVHDAQLNYYSTKLATASSDRTVQVYEIAGEVLNKPVVLTGHEGPVWQVCWAHPKFGVLLASASCDGSVVVHRETSPGVWQTAYVHRFHDSSVNGLSFAPHELGLILACASSDGKVSILQHQDDDTWVVNHFVDGKLGCNAVCWAPLNCIGYRDETGRQYMHLVTGSCDNRVKVNLTKLLLSEKAVWRCPVDEGINGEWKEESSVSGFVAHQDWVRDVAWAPLTGIPSNMIASCGEDSTVYIWTQNTPGGSWTATLMNTFDAPVWRVSWSVTGNMLAVSSGDGEVTLWKQNIDGKFENTVLTGRTPNDQVDQSPAGGLM